MVRANRSTLPERAFDVRAPSFFLEKIAHLRTVEKGTLFAKASAIERANDALHVEEKLT